jgi:hypothetical protein
MKLARILVTLFICAMFAAPAFAQEAKPVENEEFGVTIAAPDKWEVTQGNDKAVANFKHKGMQTSYKFTHSGVTLEVVVFQFTKASTAWLVVGYMQDVDAEKYMPDFKSVVQNIKFKA